MNKKILFVDDDTNMLQSLKRYLTSRLKGRELYFAESGARAVELMAENDFYAVVADYKMPGMDGLELLKKVKEMSPGSKRILLTGQSEEQVYEKAKKVADHYLAKPCDNEEFLKLIG